MSVLWQACSCNTITAIDLDLEVYQDVLFSNIYTS